MIRGVAGEADGPPKLPSSTLSMTFDTRPSSHRGRDAPGLDGEIVVSRNPATPHLPGPFTLSCAARACTVCLFGADSPVVSTSLTRMAGAPQAGPADNDAQRAGQAARRMSCRKLPTGRLGVDYGHVTSEVDMHARDAAPHPIEDLPVLPSVLVALLRLDPSAEEYCPAAASVSTIASSADPLKASPPRPPARGPRPSRRRCSRGRRCSPVL